jgi:hypothetical protein
VISESFGELPAPLARWAVANGLSGCEWVEVGDGKARLTSPQRAVTEGGIGLRPISATEETEAPGGGSMYFVSSPLRDALGDPKQPPIVYWLALTPGMISEIALRVRTEIHGQCGKGVELA